MKRIGIGEQIEWAIRVQRRAQKLHANHTGKPKPRTCFLCRADAAKQHKDYRVKESNHE